MTADRRLVLGPLLYHWPTETRLDYYRRIAEESPVDEVVLGEVICERRLPLVREANAKAAEMLEKAGKTVVQATLALPVGPKERAALSEVCATPGPVEAAEAGALKHLKGRPHRVGPFVNTYNESTLKVLVANGAEVVCLPWELGAEAIATLSGAARAGGAEVEVQAFGHVPLAISARCYTARAQGLSRDACQFVCGNDPEGMYVKTIDDQPILRVNGVQTLSVGLQVLVDEVPALLKAEVRRLRLAAEPMDMVAVAQVYRGLLDGAIEPAEAHQRLKPLLADREVCNGFYHETAGVNWIEAAS
ncbi:ubiquinone anaerobic biosynthesis protein UbiV [Roseospirillum parvum]|uniref:Ubiquinone biosynthesis protein UbiV n=1 Tax=Roseospirillum parvum TaxID=83401 RepID=A0A1G7ZNK3_9PROT|nr:U32 family peptidase [Roseospirillum parvum]SDH10342.1 Collagenase-like protease, PrtC family [Roseospirillum parvum]